MCNSGAWPPENPPHYARNLKGDAFKGQIFMAYFGGRDEEIGEKALAYGRSMKDLIEKHGGVMAQYWELPDGKHATFLFSPEMMKQALELWLK